MAFRRRHGWVLVGLLVGLVVVVYLVNRGIEVAKKATSGTSIWDAIVETAKESVGVGAEDASWSGEGAPGLWDYVGGPFDELGWGAGEWIADWWNEES